MRACSNRASRAARASASLICAFSAAICSSLLLLSSGTVRTPFDEVPGQWVEDRLGFLVPKRHEPGVRTSIIVHPPLIAQRTIEFEEIADTPGVPLTDDCLGDVVPAGLDPLGDPSDRRFGAVQPEEVQENLVPCRLQTSQPAGVGS